MKNVFARCAIAAMLAGAAGTASATISFLFNPAGTGAAGAVTATTLDQAPGSALAVNGSTAVLNCLASTGGVGGACVGGPSPAYATQLLYQANLAQLTNLAVPVFNQGDGGFNFTFSASFGEQVTAVVPISATQATAVFGLDPVQPVANFFRMYASGGAGGNNLTGAGFGAGTLILEGVIVAASSSSTTDSACVGAGTCPNLDGFNVNDWGATKTVTNNGSTQLTSNIILSMVDAGYFPDLVTGDTISVSLFANTSQVVPFLQADPSCAMIDQATGAAQGYSLGVFAAGSCTADAVKIGAVNGAGVGTDFLFQADANSSLDRVQRVPEPGTLALLAGGLMAAGLWGRRSSPKK